MNIPRNQRVGRRTPFILDHVEVRMAYTTVQHFKGHIFLTSFPAQKIKGSIFRLQIGSQIID